MNNNLEFIICVGIPGCGKSTFAKQWISENPSSRYRFNNDELLKTMTNGVYTPSAYQCIRNLQTEMINYAIANKISIVLDNTHMNPVILNRVVKDIIEINDNIKDEQDKYIIKLMDFTNIPLDVCKDRNSKREKPVPESAYTTSYSKIQEIQSIIKIYEDKGMIQVKHIDLCMQLD